MLDILKPYLADILDSLTKAIIAAIVLGGGFVLSWMRVKFQQRIAAEEVRATDKLAMRRTSASGEKIPGEVKKAWAVGTTTRRLPWHAKPVFGSVENLVRKEHEKQKRASLAPKPPEEA